jgi:hypothetical protein
MTISADSANSFSSLVENAKAILFFQSFALNIQGIEAQLIS